MIGGLKNLLAAAKSAGTKRFIHISSVAVYGDPPPASAVSEDAPTLPAPDSYGDMKLIQDRMIRAAHQPGDMQTVALCPPNISGIESPWLDGIAESLLQGSFAWLDQGAAPCAIVDVRNLAAAVLAAARAPELSGNRLFVIDEDEESQGCATWHQVVGAVAAGVGVDAAAIADVDRNQLIRFGVPKPPPKPTLVRSLKHLVSEDVREAMRKDPNLLKIDNFFRKLVARSSAFEAKMRKSVNGPYRPFASGLEPVYNWSLCAQQLRGVAHSSRRIREELGYQPAVSLDQSLRTYTNWRRNMHAMDRGDWKLLRCLYEIG
jgi:nucleoside-diphosphate-sugar epimerase